MSARATRPPSYLDQLLAELDEIHDGYAKVLSASVIRPIERGRGYVGGPLRAWAESDAGLEASRMALLRLVRGWEPRFRLLFPHPTPTVTKHLDEYLGRLERWLIRKETVVGHSVPPTIDKAAELVDAAVAGLRELARLLPPDEYAVRLTVDTNTLIDNPDLAVYVGTLGRRYMVHLLPVVLREIDDLKRGGRTEQQREGARRADRRLKGLRDNGDVLSGVRVAGEVHAVFEHIEPRDDRLPSWLELTVPDDRFTASSMLLQSEHPGSALYVATSDINLQTKLAAAGLPYIELPTPP
jgi:rRNA-processing protein FCF1